MTVRSMWSYTVTEPQTITERAVQAPAPNDLAAGEVLLRVLVGGICGSDLPFFRGKVMPAGIAPSGDVSADPLPGTPLHEVVGEVVASRDETLTPGAQVVGWATSMNAMSEYIVVNGLDVRAFAPGLSPSLAIVLQPLACVIYAVDALQNVGGSRVAVIGQGSIGVLFSHVLKTAGAAHVTGIDRVDRADVAAMFGVDEMIWRSSDRWAAHVARSTERPDIVIEAVGHQVSTVGDAITALADGGQIYCFGIPDDHVYPFPMWRFLRSCGRLYAGYTPTAARRESLRRAEDYLATNPAIGHHYVSHTFSFSQAQEAFTAANNPVPGQLKVTLEL